MLHWLPYRAYARLVVSMHTQSGSFDAMSRRYTKHLREIKVEHLPQQVCVCVCVCVCIYMLSTCIHKIDR